VSREESRTVSESAARLGPLRALHYKGTAPEGHAPPRVGFAVRGFLEDAAVDGRFMWIGPSRA